MVRVCTWLSDLRPLQSRAPSLHLLGPSFSQGPHSELEGAAGHVHAPILHAHSVHAHLGGNEAHAVGVVSDGDKLGRLSGSGGRRDLGADLVGVQS